MTTLSHEARDRLYAECARAISDAGSERESLFLARLALLLFEQLGDEARCRAALAEALRDLPMPSLSAAAAAAGDADDAGQAGKP
ncbi:hypothetical protein [Variovorax sp. KK3]|uniref:hypothetical protein n=1 Tax=Variovorax sp. KK3 TaxID=1855728 RepID=UPI00097C2796|nr:hypothetical protein [Variovorax sp. KK3]